MARARNIMGLIAGAMLLLSSAAHSFLGWTAMRGELEKARVPDDLLTGVKIGWEFGGAVMVALGVIVLSHFIRRMRGAVESIVPVAVIAATYLGFGAWALFASGLDPFFLAFIVPGALLALAAPNGATPKP